MANLHMSEADALIIVDVQNDFCPGGSLAVERGDEVIPPLNRLIRVAQADGRPIVASRDWHPPGHVSFAERGGPWPPHCVQDSEGAEFHPKLELPRDARILSKGQSPDEDQYSAFQGTGLDAYLKARGVRRLWVGGLAQDVCVRATVLDALDEGFEVHVFRDATRPVKSDEPDAALDEMLQAGAMVRDTVAVD